MVTITREMLPDRGRGTRAAPHRCPACAAIEIRDPSRYHWHRPCADAPGYRAGPMVAEREAGPMLTPEHPDIAPILDLLDPCDACGGEWRGCNVCREASHALHPDRVVGALQRYLSAHHVRWREHGPVEVLAGTIPQGWLEYRFGPRCRWNCAWFEHGEERAMVYCRVARAIREAGRG